MDKPQFPLGAAVGSGFILVLGLAFTPIMGEGFGLSMFVLGSIFVGAAGLLYSFLGQSPINHPSEQENSSRLEEQLHELGNLLDSGHITKTEYNRKRKQLIDAWGIHEVDESD